MTVKNVREPSARLDPVLLQRLFFNLMRNAHEANRDQKITVTLSVEQDESKTCVRINNTGVPISESLAQRLFDPRISRKSSSSGINMGLGLAICRKIALDHGGDLSLVENSKERGVTFQLELPRQGGKT
jgi:signal transduction histidine kinase